MVVQRYCLVIAGLLIFALVLVAPAGAAVHTLNPGDSIEQNITGAAPGDTLILNPGVYSENGITVDRNIRIQANTSYSGNAANTILDGGNARIMLVDSGSALTIDNLTLRNGNAGGVNGGAIYNSAGTLTITSSTFFNCSATTHGGAIYNFAGTLTITSSTFSNCSATYGGAIYNSASSSTLTI
ncbi:MAG: hypothetical protein M0Q92_11510, partial [Methanoregula sp.]|nr:hypothetical protein [Methanoregula sp.]